MTDLAKLVVKLEAETAKYHAELDKAKKQLGKFDKDANASIGKIAGGIAAFAVTVATGLAVAVKSQLDYADNLNDIAQRTGIATEQLSAYGLAAKQSGIDLETLAAALPKFQKNIVAASDGTGAQADAFAALGISIKDAEGNLKSTDQLLLDAADSFSQYENGAAKSAAAQALFGKSGADLIPFLNMGRDGISEMTAKAKELGLVISTETAQAADEFNDKIGLLGSSAQGFATQVMADLLPTLNTLTDDTLNSAGGFDGLGTAVDAAVGVVKAGAMVFVAIATEVENLGIVITSSAAAIKQAANGDFAQAWKTLQEGGTRVNQNTAAGMQQVADIWNNTGKKVVSAAKATDKELKKTLVFGGGEGKKTKTPTDTVGPMIKALQDQAATLTYNSQQVEIYKLKQEGATAAQIKKAEALQATIREYDNNIAKIDQAIASEEALTASYERNKDLILGEVGAAFDSYGQKLDELTVLYDAGKISIEQYEQAITNASSVMGEVALKTDETKTAVEEFGLSAKDALTDSFANFFLDTSQGFDGLLKSFGGMIQQMIAKAAAAQIMDSIMGSATSSGGWLNTAIGAVGSFFGGSFAKGGNMPANKMSLVGENGPELVVPSSTSRVYTAAQTRDMAGGGGDVRQNFYISTPDANSFRASQRQITRKAKAGLA